MNCPLGLADSGAGRAIGFRECGHCGEDSKAIDDSAGSLSLYRVTSGEYLRKGWQNPQAQLKKRY